MMVMSGLKMRVYWLVQYIFYLGQYAIMVMFLWYVRVRTAIYFFYYNRVIEVNFSLRYSFCNF